MDTKEKDTQTQEDVEMIYDTSDIIPPMDPICSDSTAHKMMLLFERVASMFMYDVNSAPLRANVVSLFSSQISSISNCPIKIICDETNNTPDVVDRCELVLTVLRPNDRYVFTLSAGQRDESYDLRDAIRAAIGKRKSSTVYNGNIRVDVYDN